MMNAIIILLSVDAILFAYYFLLYQKLKKGYEQISTDYKKGLIELLENYKVERERSLQICMARLEGLKQGVQIGRMMAIECALDEMNPKIIN